MIAARNQAEGYARALPVAEPRPPFLLVADVRHAIIKYQAHSSLYGSYQSMIFIPP